MNINQKGKDFIINWETGGKNYYEKVYKSTFIWPEGASGPTIGFGIDCAYYSKNELKEIFSPYVSAEELSLILGAPGKSGSAGQAYTKKLKGIIITWDEAKEIFDKFTLPKFTSLAEKVFPGVNDLCENAQAAILSLVFNRGTALGGQRRIEMANIKKMISTKNYKSIATEFRKMKRLWKNNPNSDSDLTDRRESEAKLVESCI
jgi:GH24 family phage-related lysozyme (muramidase)